MLPPHCFACTQQNLQVLVHLKIGPCNICDVVVKQMGCNCLYSVHKMGVFSDVLLMAVSELAGNNKLFLCFLNSSI